MSAPRLSSALILRRSEDDPRLHLAHRREDLRLFGGVYAFCGGSVEPVDDAVGTRCSPSNPALGALRSTLLREMIEELALDLRPGAPDRGAVREAERRALLEDASRWEAMVEPNDLAAVGDPALRLVTPDFYPRRVDTAFFLDVLGERVLPRPWAGELDADGWDTPRGWLDRWNAGEFLLAPPTVLTLRALEGVPWRDFPAALRALQEEIESDTPHPIHNDPAVRLIPLRTPTLPPARFTNAYLVGTDPCYLVDPATPHPDEQERLARAVERARREGMQPTAILLTHHHPDHVGAVQFARERWQLPVWAHPLTAERVPFAVDRLLVEGETLPLGTTPAGATGWELRCVFTPGHAPGHLCFLDSHYGALIAGDMVSTLSSILIHPDDGDLDDYMNSLERLAELPVRVVYPAHGPADTRGARALRLQLDHRRARTASVCHAIGAGAHSVESITAAVYVDVPRPMLGYAAHSVRSILVSLERAGRVILTGESVRPR